MFTDWHGCYDEGWQGSGCLLPESFAHPAKFSYSLINRIVRHGIDQRYWRAGDLIGDPFGGVACGGIVCGYHGLNWVGVELEPRFVELGNKNIALHGPRWLAMEQTNRVVLLQGDSRRFAEVVGEHLAGAVTSPPYETSNQNYADGWKTIDGKKGVHDRYSKQREAEYGATAGQIGSLPSGSIDAAITSPPYAEAIGNPNAIDYSKAKGKHDGLKPSAARDSIGGPYGVEPGQIGALSAGNIDASITSPPYVDSINNRNGIDHSKFQDGTRYGPNSQANMQGYGRADGQIGAIRSVGDVDGIVTSPPYAATDTKPTKLGTGKGTRADGDSAGRNKGDYHYPESEGQIGVLSSGEVDAVITSPPFESGCEGVMRADKFKDPLAFAEKMRHTGHGASLEAKIAAMERENERADYGHSTGQIGDSAGETYWQAMALVYRQMWLAMKPGAVAAIVVKDYVKNKTRVPLCDDTCRLLASVGFEVFERSRCWLVKETREASLFGGEHVKTKERKSFFRRLAEKKGSPRIDFEEVIWCRRSVA